jgi:uncharacterized membrane protein
MKKVFILSLVFLTWVLYACKHQVLNPADPGTGGGTGSGVTHGTNLVCFEADVLPLLQSSCGKPNLACHAANSGQKGYYFTSYDSIKVAVRPGNASESKLYKMITEDDPRKRMPLGFPELSTAQKELIKKWINEGAQNTRNCGNTCDTATFSFAAAVNPILQTNCVSCHTGATGYNGIDLSTHAGTKAAATSGKLMPAITHTGLYKMPKSNPQRKLSDCQITQIRKWIDAGTPNN